MSGTHRLAISAADAQVLVHAQNVVRVGIVGHNVIGSTAIEVKAWLVHQLDLPPLLLLHKLHPRAYSYILQPEETVVVGTDASPCCYFKDQVLAQQVASAMSPWRVRVRSPLIV